MRNYASNDIEDNTHQTEVTEDAIEYNCADLLYQSICCFKSKSKNENSVEVSLGKRHEKYTKDLDKFYSEIDVFNLIFTIKHLKFLVNNIYSEIKNQRLQQSIESQAEK